MTTIRIFTDSNYVEYEAVSEVKITEIVKRESKRPEVISIKVGVYTVYKRK